MLTFNRTLADEGNRQVFKTGSHLALGGGDDVRDDAVVGCAIHVRRGVAMAFFEAFLRGKQRGGRNQEGEWRGD